MEVNLNHKKIELLAPAGGMEQVKAAVENGADAIYIGGRKFNARMNASNFTIEEMEEALRYAKSRDVKIFVAINILMKDEELMEAVDYIAQLYEIGIDAVILQDLGLAALVRKYVPDMEMHFSTQGSIYNRSGVKNALKLGFKRVVLAREMSLAEIKETTDLCDIEVFIHGAMCMCYSGQCQMSRMMGGRSGNRGSCAQPCRLPYEDDKGNKSFILSPKDMCTIDNIGELIDAGVMSLKIEGRMKSPEYVATVVAIYRKYIDLYYKNGTYQVSQQDRQELAQIYNRGGFTSGYLNGNPGQKLLSGNLSKHQGIFAGTVVKNRDHDLVEVQLEPGITIENGDAIEIRSQELMGNMVTYVQAIQGNKQHKEKQIKEHTVNNKATGRVIIGDIKGVPRPGDKVYKTRSKDLMDRARENSKEYTRKKDIGAVFTGIEGEYPVLCLYTEEREVNITGTVKVEKALKRPLEHSRIEEQLKKTGNTPFNITYICCTFSEDCTMPIKEINQMRRQAIEELTEVMVNKHNRVDLKTLHNVSSITDAISIENSLQKNEEVKGVTQKTAILQPQITRELSLSWISGQESENSHIKIFSNITKGAEDKEIKKILNTDLTGTVVILNNLGWLEEFNKAGAKVYAGPGINVSNSISEKLLNSMGVEVVAWSLETEEKAELLMVTEHPIESSYIKDRKGKKYSIKKSRYGDKYYIINSN